MILAIETSAGQCAVALVGSGVSLSRALEMERGHAEHLFDLIAQVMAEADALPADICRIAVCTGPGSFTGIRIGVAAARGLALGLGVPAVGISRFAALAQTFEGAVDVVLRGRDSTVHVQSFEGPARPSGPPRTIDAEQVGALIGRGVPVIGDGAATGGPGLADPRVVARLGALAGPEGNPAVPLYLRGADADPPRHAPPVMLAP